MNLPYLALSQSKGLSSLLKKVLSCSFSAGVCSYCPSRLEISSANSAAPKLVSGSSGFLHFLLERAMQIPTLLVNGPN